MVKKDMKWDTGSVFDCTSTVSVFATKSGETDRNVTQNTQQLPLISETHTCQIQVHALLLLAVTYIFLLIQSRDDEVWLHSLKDQSNAQCFECVRG